jgi:hypothetical protein
VEGEAGLLRLVEKAEAESGQLKCIPWSIYANHTKTRRSTLYYLDEKPAQRAADIYVHVYYGLDVSCVKEGDLTKDIPKCAIW